jgi:hypothetical protein
MEQKITPPDDSYLIRCPRLGHQVSFSYCRFENNNLPCFKSLDCWFRHFPVEDYLRMELTPEEWQRVFESPPKTKVQSLVELIEKAKKRSKEET